MHSAYCQADQRLTGRAPPSTWLTAARDRRCRVTPRIDTNGIGCHDPLSDVCALPAQVDDHIRQPCGIF